MIRDWPDLFLALETQYDIEVHGLPDAAIMKLNWAHKYYGAARFQDQVPFRVRNSDGWIRIPASKVSSTFKACLCPTREYPLYLTISVLTLQF